MYQAGHGSEHSELNDQKLVALLWPCGLAASHCRLRLTDIVSGQQTRDCDRFLPSS